ncbi:hypothetical protein NGRA_0751 [Nosema granulosis]|uniref:Uncharacterized protein n=1 Tax=Nosema granulosis TaxID=83296 RepID=A0A9P6H1G1_9MICR|nr:hypothetical protein NGRA_0751 [Nosema granulosis]
MLIYLFFEAFVTSDWTENDFDLRYLDDDSLIETQEKILKRKDYTEQTYTRDSPFKIQRKDIEEDSSINSQASANRQKDFDLICNSILPGLGKHLTENERILLYVQYPMLCSDTSIYLNIILKINTILINLLDFYLPTKNFRKYKIKEPKTEKIIIYKNKNRSLLNIFKSEKRFIETYNNANLYSRTSLVLIHNLVDLLQYQNFTLETFQSLFYKLLVKKSFKQSLVINIIYTLKSSFFRKNYVNNSSSIFLSIIEDLDGNNAIRSLFYFYSYLKSIEITIKTQNETQKQIFNENSKMIFALLKQNISLKHIFEDYDTVLKNNRFCF